MSCCGQVVCAVDRVDNNNNNMSLSTLVTKRHHLHYRHTVLRQDRVLLLLLSRLPRNTDHPYRHTGMLELPQIARQVPEEMWLG